MNITSMIGKKTMHFDRCIDSQLIRQLALQIRGSDYGEINTNWGIPQMVSTSTCLIMQLREDI